MALKGQISIWETMEQTSLSVPEANDSKKNFKSCSIGLLVGVLSAGLVLAIFVALLIKDRQLKTSTTLLTTISSTTTTTSASTLTSTTSSTSTSTSTSSSTSSSSSTSTSSTSTTSTSTTTTSISNAEISWNFDNNLQDTYNNYNGIGNGGPTFQSPSYSGVGTCLKLNQSLNQSVTISTTSYLNLINTSFTFTVWFYANSLYNGTPYLDNLLIEQYEQHSTDRALHITIRSQHAYFGFFADDLTGTQLITIGSWYHVAFVYSYPSLTQMIYINGILDASRTGAGPYLGNQSQLTIGTGSINAPNNYFDGCLDSINYYPRVRNSTEILRDATLVAYLKFDGNTLYDSGPLRVNGTGASYTYMSSGRVNQALTLSTSSSYIQIRGLTRFGTSGWPYTVSIWIYTTSLSGGTIMHLSSSLDGSQPSAWCLPIMGLTSTGSIAINSWNGSNVPLTGPTVSPSTWTHVAATYSLSNGETLYVNGNQVGAATGAYMFRAGEVPMTLTLGSSLVGTTQCNTGTIQMGQFYGSLDEFRVYARELSASEIYVLATP